VLLNRLEILFSVYEEPVTLSKKEVFEIFPKHAFSYERADDHYDVISAFIKSIRGSDPDAAIYWLAVMLEGGEDPRFVARRLAILAAEDIGLAEPGALAVINGGYDLVEKIGMPEARIILSEMTVYLASLPKSNSAYMAVEKALNHVRNNPVMRVPDHLKDSHYAGAKKLGRGKGYQYSHDFPYHYVKQNYTEKPVSFYEPGTLGREKKFKEYLEFLKTLKTR
jgi:putative ATPase